MRQAWEDDQSWSDQYLPTVQAICGYYFIGKAPREEDIERNTDLIVLNISGIRVAVRIRKYPYWMTWKYGRYLYRGDFTIRWSRPYGTLTEWDKIMANFGDFFFYGFADETAPKLRGFGILDLQKFRVWAHEYQKQYGDWPGRVIPNGDRTQFRAIRWAEVPTNAILVTWPRDVAEGISLMPQDLRRAIQLGLEYVIDT